MNRKDLEMILPACGVDIDQLNAGPRGFDYMLGEINGKDVRPHFIARQPEHPPGPKWVFVLLRDTVTIVAEVGQGTAREMLHECHRIYPDGSKLHRKGFQTISETRKIDEDFLTTAQRAFEEELQVSISREQIHAPTPMELMIYHQLRIDGLEYRVKNEWSSVYKGVWSTAYLHPFIVRLPERPWPEDTRDIDDCGVTIRLEYVKPTTIEVPEFLAEKVRALR